MKYDMDEQRIKKGFGIILRKQRGDGEYCRVLMTNTRIVFKTLSLHGDISFKKTGNKFLHTISIPLREIQDVYRIPGEKTGTVWCPRPSSIHMVLYNTMEFRFSVFNKEQWFSLIEKATINTGYTKSEMPATAYGTFTGTNYVSNRKKLEEAINSNYTVHKWGGIFICILLFSAVIMEQINPDFGEKKIEEKNTTVEKAVHTNSHRSGQAIVDAVQRNSPKLRAVISNYPDIDGKVLFSIGITPRGVVDTCFIEESDITDAVFLTEVIDSIRTFQFNPVARADDCVLITYPFVFTH
ncbi:MAG: hypothetical protein ACQEQ4_03300 [Fibrobacterota bacterium]